MGEERSIFGLLKATAAVQEKTNGLLDRLVSNLVENTRPHRAFGQLPDEATDKFSALQAEGLIPDETRNESIAVAPAVLLPALILDETRWQRKRVIIKARGANIGNIFLGLKDGTTTNITYPLLPGDEITVPLANAGEIWARAANANDVLHIWPWGIGTPARGATTP